MSSRRARGATLVVGLVLLSLVTLLGLAGASGAHVEQQLAQNEQFRENAASAASAGIELAIGRIMNSPSPASLPGDFAQSLPDGITRVEVRVRVAGVEPALAQRPGANLVGTHIDIDSTGFSARRSVDRQRATVMLVTRSAAAAPLPCEPEAAGVRCAVAGELARLSWQRVAVE